MNIWALIPVSAVIGLFTFLTVMIIRVTDNRRLAREKLYDVARAAVEKGQPLPPEVIASLSDVPAARRTAFSDLRTGVILIAARAYVRHVRREQRYDLMAETPDDADFPLDPGLKVDLDAALAQLSAPERLVVTLCTGAGHSHPEAAELLNLPLGTIKSHGKRGLDKLRRLMAPELKEVAGPHG